MKIFLKVVPTILFLLLIGTPLGILFLLTIRAKRSSRLYRLRLGILGMIVGLMGAGMTGCDCWGTQCYAGIEFDSNEDQLPEKLEVEEEETVSEISPEAAETIDSADSMNEKDEKEVDQ